jgi:hypothetical protein
MLSKERYILKLKRTFNREQLINYYVCRKNNTMEYFKSGVYNGPDSEIGEISDISKNKKITKDFLASEIVRLEEAQCNNIFNSSIKPIC